MESEDSETWQVALRRYETYLRGLGRTEHYIDGRPPSEEERQRLDAGGQEVWEALRELIVADDMTKLAGGE